MFFCVFAIFALGLSTTGSGTMVGGKLLRGPTDETPMNIASDVPLENWVAAHGGSERCWPWKNFKRPRLVIVVRWYFKQNIIPLLVTLDTAARAAKETVKVKIVDTDPIPSSSASSRGNISFSELERQLSKCHDIVRWLDVQLFRAPVLSPELEKVYGYGQTDWVLQQLQDDMDWHHILITNGDNIYSMTFLRKTLHARQLGCAVIGVDFVSHYEGHAIKNTLEYLHSDIGSLIFHRGTVEQRGNCSCGLTFQAASKVHGWHDADAGFLALVQNCSDNSQFMIH